MGIGKGLAWEGLGRKVDACKVEAVYRNLSRSTKKVPVYFDQWHSCIDIT